MEEWGHVYLLFGCLFLISFLVFTFTGNARRQKWAETEEIAAIWTSTSFSAVVFLNFWIHFYKKKKSLLLYFLKPDRINYFMRFRCITADSNRKLTSELFNLKHESNIRYCFIKSLFFNSFLNDMIRIFSAKLTSVILFRGNHGKWNFARFRLFLFALVLDCCW